MTDLSLRYLQVLMLIGLVLIWLVIDRLQPFFMMIGGM
jgi:hypothetical protein